MSRDDIAIVRTTLYGLGESVAERLTMNRMGALVVADLFDQLVLSGYAYHMQIGTEDAPVNSTTSIDDILVEGLIDNNDGYACIPLLFEVNIDFTDTAVNSDIMLEFDKDQKRYSSGGTAFVPANMRSDNPHAWNGACYVGTDIAAVAKTAVPGSVELARRAPHEDVVTDPTTGKMNLDPVIYSCKTRPIVLGVDACSFLQHIGAGTADLNIYSVFQIAQFDKTLVV